MAGPRTLAFDLDGTLAPIAPRPGLARVPAARLRLLRALSRQPGVRLALVSGRSLEDLRAKAPVGRCVYFGDHGMRCSRRAWDTPAPRRRAWRAAIRRALGPLVKLEGSCPGLLLEDKGPHLSVHLRQVAPSRRRGVERAVRRACAGLPLRVSRGKRVLELRPLGAPDKGVALRRLAAADGARPLLYAGDDRTDEDAFRALAGLEQALTVKVGAGPSWARFRVPAGRIDALLRGLLKGPRRRGG